MLIVVARVVVLTAAGLVVTACSTGAGPAATSSAEIASPSASTPASAGSGEPAGSGGSPQASGASVTSPDQAAQLVIASDPRFADIQPRDPNLIGQCCWYEARRVEGGYQVEIVIGWGDCPAGCIDSHKWTFAVAPTGQAQLIGESGDPVPPGVGPGG